MQDYKTLTTWKKWLKLLCDVIGRKRIWNYIMTILLKPSYGNWQLSVQLKNPEITNVLSSFWDGLRMAGLITLNTLKKCDKFSDWEVKVQFCSRRDYNFCICCAELVLTWQKLSLLSIGNECMGYIQGEKDMEIPSRRKMILHLHYASIYSLKNSNIKQNLSNQYIVYKSRK